MISVLALGLVERIINGALNADPNTTYHLNQLTGKTLRLIIQEPAISLDVLFCDDHLRFEPVSQSIFEPQGDVPPATPDCLLTVATPSELLKFMRNRRSGNLPIKGDYKVLASIKALTDDFRPDVFDKLENIIGKNAGSYTYLVAQELSPIITPVLSSIKSLLIDALIPNQPPQGELDATISQKKQELLRLQADIEREQARLTTLKNQSQS